MTLWLVETLFALSALMLLVLALRSPVARFLGAKWSYALWLAPAMRLLLPPISLPGSQAPSRLIANIPESAISGALPSSAPAVSNATWLALWAGGAIAFLSWQLFAHARLVRSIRSSAKTANPPSYGGIPVLESRAVSNALAVGLWARQIVVPADFHDRYGEFERQLVLDHELLHHRRGDIWWSWLALLVLAVNWFNPIAYLAFRAFRTDQELSCDAAVAAGLSTPQRYAYARALVKSATRHRLITACPLNQASQLKQRLKMLGSHEDRASLRTAGLLAVATVVVTGLAATPSSGLGLQTAPREFVSKISGGASLPAPPLAGAAAAEPCPPGQGVTSEELDLGDRKVARFISCFAGHGRTPAELNADLVKTLEEARADVVRRQPSGPQKDRTLAALDAELARLRAR